MERKEGLYHDSKGREKKQQPTNTERQNGNDKKLATHTLHDVTETKISAVPPPAATHHARRATPRPMPQRTKQRRSNHNRSPRKKPLEDATERRVQS
jgi:hypothetical protein